MANKKKKSKPSGFNVESPKVGLFPAGSIVKVSGTKIVLADKTEKPKK